MLDRPHSILVDLSAAHEARRHLTEFGNAVASGQYEEFMEDIRAASRETLIRTSKLSPREIEVFHGISTGNIIKVVAADLKLSEVTIKIHIGDIKRKLSDATESKINSTTKMVLLYWGVSAEALAKEKNRQLNVRSEPNRRQIERKLAARKAAAP